MIQSRSKIEKLYFEWMFDLVCEGQYAEIISYKKLLEYLHSVEFTYSIEKDADRAEDGIELRYRFAYETERPYADRYLIGPCSVLEMMIALALRCEEVMDDTAYGDRTAQWFWKMVVNLGLGDMLDSRFDEYHVEKVIERFLNREFEPDGRGGLFRVKHCDYDLRYVELWKAMCWMLDEFA